MSGSTHTIQKTDRQVLHTFANLVQQTRTVEHSHQRRPKREGDLGEGDLMT